MILVWIQARIKDKSFETSIFGHSVENLKIDEIVNNSL